MIAERKRASFIPALNSIYLSDFGDEVPAAIKSLRYKHLGGDKYLGNRVWEVSEEEWKYLEHFPHTFIDHGVGKPSPTVFIIDKDSEGGLYYYQEEAAQELMKRTEALLFFDTGTGKTRTSLLALSHLSRDWDAAIVVGEANLSSGWKEQAQKHFPGFSDRVLVLNDGSSIPKRIKMIQQAEKGTIFILNIESVRNKALVEALNDRNLAVTVLDECQYIIGTSAQQTAGMHDIKSDFRWALSATPIMNSPLEWHSLLAWLRVVPLDGALTRFKEYYAFAVRDKFGRWQYTSFRNQEDLEDLKNLVTIRVEKTGLGLPPRYIQQVEFEENEELKKLLKEIKREKRRDEVEATFEIHGQTFEADNLSDLFYIERIATASVTDKIDFVLRQKEEPMVVVSSFKFPLNYLHSLLGEESVLYHGDISKEDRDKAKKDFIDGKNRVFLMTRKSGGTGLDGLQERASIMIFLDAPDNEQQFNQCADRLHRIRQTKSVFIYILKSKGSLDTFAWDNMEEKQRWVDRYYKVQYEEMGNETGL